MTMRSVAQLRQASVRSSRPGFSAANIGIIQAGAALDPFIGIDHFVMRVPVFPPHPHAGFSALTYLFEDSEGAFTNRDSLGHSLRIEPGELHWTNAGRGIIHEEIPASPGQRIHGLQIFVNLPAARKLDPPSVLHLASQDVPIVERPGARVRVVLGDFDGVASPLTPPTPVTLLDVRVAPGGHLDCTLPSAANAFLYVLDGAVDAGGGPAPRGAVVSFRREGGAVSVSADASAGAWFVLFAGEPLGEVSVSNGPFVMSSEQQLARAVADYRAGRMGHLEPTLGAAWLGRP